MIAYSQLNKLKPEIKALIKDNAPTIKRLFQHFEGLGRITKAQGKVFSAKEIDATYNSEISTDEKKAWVWWKRSIGVEMKGWEQYYINSKTEKTELIYTTKQTMIKDNHFRDLQPVRAGKMLGKFIKAHKYSKTETYWIIRTEEGLVYVLSTHCKRQTNTATASQSELNKLIKNGSLYYVNGEYLPLPVYGFGNMYDRQLSLADDKAFIIATYGQDTYDRHYNVCHKACSAENPMGALPVLKSVTNPEKTERPVISVISNLATDEYVFTINTVRDEYMDAAKSEDLTMVNGRVEVRKNKDKIKLEFDGDERYTLQTVFIKWLFTLNVDTDFDKSTAPEIVDYFLRKKPYRNSSAKKGKAYDAAKREMKARAINEGEALFERFLHEVLVFEDQRRLDFLWNRLYNGQSVVKYNKIPVMFSASRLFKNRPLLLKPMQREVLGFFEMQGSGVLSLDVGGGKTIVMILSIAAGLMQGRFKRPLLVVPKPVYEQFIKEMQGFTDSEGNLIEGVLSNTGIKINAWENLGEPMLKKMKAGKLGLTDPSEIKLLQKAVPEGSITVIQKEGIKKLGFTKAQIEGYLADLVEIMEDEKEKEKKESARQTASKKQSVRSKIGLGVKDSIADFDVLGFDAIYADEAHAYKNIFAGVPAEKTKEGRDKKEYDLTGSVSDIGTKMFFFANYVQRKFGRNVVLATATPFTKAILEVYSMLSLVALEHLKRNNILNLKRFCDMFIRRDLEWVANYREELEQKEVIKQFVNVDVLRRMIGNYVFYRSKADFTNVNLPCLLNLPLVNRKEKGRIVRLSADKQVLTYLRMSDVQRETQTEIIDFIKSSDSPLVPVHEKRAMVFRGLNMSIKNAFSPYFLERNEFETANEFVENSPKIHAACLAILSVFKDYGSDMPGQIIYSNRGKDYFYLIKEYLVKKGFKINQKFNRSRIDEVEIITASTSGDRKEIIKEAFNAGICKIIIGTSTIQEGLNLQQHATDIHVISSEWNPTAAIQLAGRVHRQGNPFAYCRFIYYLLQDSIDVPMFQKNEEKIARINDLLMSSGSKVIDTDTLDAEEIKYALITDIDLIVKMMYDQEFEELEKKLNRVNNSIKTLSETKTTISNYDYYRDELIENIRGLNNDLYYKERTFTSQLDLNDAETRSKAKGNLDRLLFLKDEITKVLGFDDRELLKLSRSLVSFCSKHYVSVPNGMRYSYFSEYVSRVAKIEKTILMPKGKTRKDDLTEVMAEYEADKAVLLKEEKTFEPKTDDDPKTSERWWMIRSVAEAKKNKLSINGQTANEVAKSIASLNYLLAYKLEDKPSTCAIANKRLPAKKDKPPVHAKTNADADAELTLILILQEQALALKNKYEYELNN